MGELVGNQDWLRLLLMVGFAVYLIHRIQKATDKLFEEQIGSTEIAKDSYEEKFPSITFCPGYSLENSHDYGNVSWNVEDMLVSISQRININKYVMSSIDLFKLSKHGS